MTAWVVFLGTAAGVIVFVFGRGWVRSVRAWFRPEPLAPMSKYQNVRTGR
jgi:uncharacterized membrane protein